MKSPNAGSANTSAGACRRSVTSSATWKENSNEPRPICLCNLYPDKLWAALTDPEMTRKYWFGCWQDCAWTAGSSWKLMFEDGRLADAGDVLDIDPPRRLGLKW